MAKTSPKTTTKSRRLITSSLLLVLILVALYVTIARQTVVWISDYKIELQTKLSKVLHTPISIGELKGGWDIFSPTLTAYNIYIGEQAQTLEVDQLTLEIDIPQSILNWQVRIAGIHGENLKLQVRENQPDTWSIGGIPRQKDPITPEIILSQLQRFKKLSINNSTISVHPYNQPSRIFKHVNASLTHLSDEKMRLDGILYINEDKPLILSASASINPKHWYKLKGRLYADIPYQDWQGWLPKDISLPWKLQSLIVGGQVWASIKEGQLTSATIKTKGSQVVVQHKQNEPVIFKDIKMTAWFNRYKQSYTDLQIANLSFDANKTNFKDLNLLLIQRLLGNDEQLNLQANTLNIEKIIKIARMLAPTPQAIQEAIQEVAPKGIINNLQLTWLPNKPLIESLNFSADVDKISFNPFKETVGAGNISGKIQGGINKGQLILDADNFSLYIAKLYNKPWSYQQANANLSWAFDGEMISIFSPLMKLSGEEGKLTGDMMIRLFPQNPIKDYMDLRVNIAEGNASYTPKYIPTKAKIDPNLVHWLNTSIISGDIETGFFQFQGSLDKQTPPTAHTLLLYMKTSNTEINYQAPWLPIRKVKGEVFVEPSGVKISASEGFVSNSKVTDIKINIPIVSDPAITRLHLNASINTTVDDTLHILKSSPTEISDVFSGWQGKGGIVGTLQLNIPLKKYHQPTVITEFTTKNALLNLQYPIPPLIDLAGTFHYDSRYGLSSQLVTAKVFGNKIQGTIEANGKAEPLSYLKLKGTADIAKLADWYIAPKKDWPLNGKTSYNLDLWISKNNKLKISSDFKGITFDLPPPFNKTAEQVKSFSYQMDFGKQQNTQLQINYGSLISAAITMDQNKRNWQGELLVNQGKASFSNKKGVEVRAIINQLDLEKWFNLYEKYLSNQKTNNTKKTFNINELHSINLLIGQVTGFNIPPQQAAIYIQPTGEQGWRLDIDSQILFGRVTAPQVKNLPYYIYLKYLKIPESLITSVKKSNSASHFDINKIPNLNLSIKQVFLGNDPIGKVKFNNTHHEKGLKVSDISLNLRGIQVRGDLDWQIGNQTSFNGMLLGKNLDKALSNWNIKPPITAKSFKVVIDGTWPGSPTDLRLNNFTGTLSPELKAGRLLSVDGSSSNVLRIFGILNSEAIARRLRLDFTDLYKPGLTYDSIKGEFIGHEGLLKINKPFVFEGPSMLMSMTGQINTLTQQVDANLKVGIPLGSNISLATLAVVPPLGGAMLVVDYFLGNELMKLAAVSYSIKGDWNDPTISLSRL